MGSSIFSIAFWIDALERSIKTAAQFVIGAWGLGDGIFNLFELDFNVALGAAAGGAVLSILTSLISAPFSTDGTASVTN